MITKSDMFQLYCIPNRSKIIRFLVWFVGCFILGNATFITRGAEVSFRSLTTLNGLSQNDVNCIFKDSRGFMWFGTNDGLNRYDGYDFKIYQVTPDKPGSIISNLIYTLDEDCYGRLWIGSSDEGLFIFDLGLNRFRSVTELCPNAPSKEHVMTIHVSSSGMIWVGTFDGGYVLIPKSRDSYQYLDFNDFLEPQLTGSLKRVSSVFEDENHAILLTGDERVYYVPDGTDTLNLSIKEATGIQYGNCFQILKQEGHYLIFGIAGINIVYPNYSKGTFSWGQRLVDYPIRKAVIDADGRIWCAGNASDLRCYRIEYNGIYAKGIQEQSITMENNWDDKVISSLYAEPSGMVWIGVNGRGILSSVPHINRFRKYTTQNNIRSIYEDKDRNVWIGSEDGVISFLSAARQRDYQAGFVHSNVFNKTTYPGEVYSIAASGGKNTVYAGLGYPLKFAEINYNQGRCSVHTPEYSKDFYAIFDIYQDRNGVLWLASYLHGLYVVYPEKEGSPRRIVNHSFLPEQSNGISSAVVRSVMEDREGNIWLGTEKGVCILTHDLKYNDHPTFIAYKHQKDDPRSLSHNYVLPIFQSRQGDVWIGTMGGGINRVRAGQEISSLKFEHITTENGLPNNVIKAIVEDDENSLWCSTNRGLVRYFPETGELNSYDITDGLQDFEFGELAACKRSDGEILFGGVKGFNAFYPCEIGKDTTVPKMVLTELRILNQTIEVGQDFRGRILLDSSLMKTSKVRLKYDESIVEFQFSALHYAGPHKHKYRYMLEGFDKDWVNTSSDNRIAKYTFLPPGSYRFKVEGSNLDGVWCKAPAVLVIEVSPPWWKTWIAYLVYLLVALLILYLIIHYSVVYNRRRTELRMAHFEKEKVQELSQMKLQFYTNISHEFRTPLTLILGPLNRLIADGERMPESKRRASLIIIQRNAAILLRLINQLLDFRKLEQDKMQLQAIETNLNVFVSDVYESFRDYADQRNISLHLRLPELNVMIWADNDKLEKVLYNLLSNAIKFTQPAGTVTLKVSDYSDSATISVQDTGLGMDLETQNHIFERFYQSGHTWNRKVGSTGIGLALSKGFVELHNGSIDFVSELNKGTTFTVRLPKGREHLSDNEIIAPAWVNEWDKIQPNGLNYWEHPVTREDIPEESLPDRTKVLVVEDHDDLRNYLSERLRETFIVYDAMDGQEGYEKCLSEQPDMVICDVMMPRMDGYTLCAKLKSDERISHLPIILLTAKDSPEHKLEGYRAGADGYVAKPFEFEILEAQIHAILNSREQMRKAYQKAPDLSPSEVAMTGADTQFLERLLKIIEENMRDDSFSVEMLADQYGMTQNLLNKKLKALTGLPTKAFIRSIRLKRAAQLLKLGRYTVADVTYEVGMNDLKYFRQCFKAEFGVTPSEYQKQSNDNR